MLGWTEIYLINAVLAALFGFGELGGRPCETAKKLFYVFTVFFILSFIFHRTF